MDLKETQYEDVHWIHLALDRDQWRTLVNTIMNLLVLRKKGNFLTRMQFRTQFYNAIPTSECSVQWI
jgi:hypothetical protein